MRRTNAFPVVEEIKRGLEEVTKSSRRGQRSRRGVGGSVGVFVGEAADEGKQDNEEIEGQSPVADVVEIVFDSFFNGCVASPAVDLGPAGNTYF